MDEEGHEDGEAEFWVCMVSGVSDETFGEFVEGNGGGGLEADGEEGIGRDVMMVLLLRVVGRWGVGRESCMLAVVLEVGGLR